VIMHGAAGVRPSVVAVLGRDRGPGRRHAGPLRRLRARLTGDDLVREVLEAFGEVEDAVTFAVVVHERATIGALATFRKKFKYQR